MISAFRHFLNSWAARGFFLLLVAVFIVWGVGSDVLRMMDSSGDVATVGKIHITLDQANEAYRRQLAEVTRSLGTNIDPTPEIRRAVAAQSLQGLVVQAAMDNAAQSMDIVTPDDAVRQAITTMQAFKGPDGAFSRDVFQAVLRNNNYTEARFLDLVRNDLRQRQLIGAARAGSNSPDALTRAVFAFQRETRVAETASFAFVSAPKPDEPTDTQLTRWYENHPDLYSTREVRSFTAALLSPDTLGRDVQISDADVQAAWEASKTAYQKPEKRSVQVLLTQDQDKAIALAAIWATGADWAEMQKKAQDDGAAAVELTSATHDEFPAPELGDAVFQAAEGTIPPPVKSALGWHVLKVTSIEAGGTQSFEQVAPTLRARLVAEKASDLIDASANKLDDTLAGGAKLTELPPDLGVATVSITCDANGLDAEGKPAVLPEALANNDTLRAAVLAEAFRMKPGDPAHLIDAPRPAQDSPPAYFAVSLDTIIPPAPKPITAVAAQVRDDWTHDAVRHNREEAAAGVLAAVKAGKSLADAAAAAGVPVTTMPPVGRAAPVPGVPAQLIEPLFTLKQGEATMVETEDGFFVALLAEIKAADPDLDPLGFGQVRDALARTLADDLQASIAFAVRDRVKPTVNQGLANQIAQPE